MGSIATSPRAEEISFTEVLNRMKKIGVEFEIPKDLPAEIQLKWEEAMAGLHNILFPNETAYVPALGPPGVWQKVPMTSVMTLNGYLKVVESIILELKEYPEVQKFIGNALTYLLNNTFGSDIYDIRITYELKSMITRLFSPLDSLPILFKMLEQEYGKDLKEAIAAEIADAIILLPLKSEIRKQYLKRYVDKELCFEINIPQRKKIGTEILPYLVDYYRKNLESFCANPFDAVAAYLEGLGIYYLEDYGTNTVDLESFKQVFSAFMEIYNLLYCNWVDLRFRIMMEHVVKLNDSELDGWISMQIKTKLAPEIIQEIIQEFKGNKDLVKFLP